MPDTRPLRTISDLGLGNHACCFFEAAEKQRAVVMPFLRQGLEKGNKAVYILDVSRPETIVGYFRRGGLDLEPYLTRGQMMFLTSDETHVREGVFDPDRMLVQLQAQTDQALAEGYGGLYITCETAWALRGVPGSERLIEYEGKVNEFFPGSKCVALCQYDWRAFGPQLLMDVLSTHPITIVNAVLYDNYYYMSPATVLGHDVSASQLRHWSKHLAERRSREETPALTLDRGMERWAVYGLTLREFAVLRLVVAGKSDAEVGTALGINVVTANKHVSHILHKLGVTSRTQAGVKAVREGLVE